MHDTETSSKKDEPRQSKIDGQTNMKLIGKESMGVDGNNTAAMEEVKSKSGHSSNSGTPKGGNNNNSKSNKNGTDGGSKENSAPKDTSGTNGISSHGPSSSTISKDASGKSSSSSSSKSQQQAPSATPPPPVLKGTLSYNLDNRRHLIRGNWKYENSNAFPPQRFELIRNLDPSEDPTILPKDGIFYGSFSLVYYHTTSKGKQKERSKVIQESGVNIKFTKLEEGAYKVDGKGTNQFGIFHINGKATPSRMEGDPEYDITLRKRYEPSTETPNSSATASITSSSSKKRKIGSTSSSNGGDNNMHNSSYNVPITQPPPPSKSFPSHIVCLRGKLTKGPSADALEVLGSGENTVQRIQGLWAAGLNFLVEDPHNTRGLCQKFEYEHKSMVPSNTFPVSGKYSGWFNLSKDDGTKARINEQNVDLRFIKNSEGYHNVEGKGKNVFGKYTISGSLTKENIITIFRHFQPIKSKKSTVTSAPPPINSSTQPRKPTIPPEKLLKLDDVKVPNESNPDEPVEPFKTLSNTSYSAVERGVLRIDADGSHVCQGKWAVTREHFEKDQKANSFNFRLEVHFAEQAAKEAAERAAAEKDGGAASTTPLRAFPLDSAMYKGSFQLKKGTTRYQTIVDQQIVMKFRKNTQGSYNVYGKGTNAVGGYNLVGTLILHGARSGQVELYRIYPPAPPVDPTKLPVGGVAAPGPGSGLHPTTMSSGSGSGSGAGGSTNLSGTKALMNASSSSFPTVKSNEPSSALLTPGLASGNGIATKTAMGVPVTSAILPQASTSGVVGVVGGAVGVVGGAVVPRATASTLQRRESTRLVKLPSRLEEDDPKAQFTSIMQKCGLILRQMREKDLENQGFFSEPVDPIALGIPSYHEVIKEPMDLTTVHKRMENNEIDAPEEFARLVRLVFENAIKFNVDPSHSVHQAARNLLIIFNQKFRDVERQIENFRKIHARGTDFDTDASGKGKKKKKDDKKRKRGAGAGRGDDDDKGRSMKRRRLEEAKAMATASDKLISEITAAAPPGTADSMVTRREFNMMLQLMQLIAKQNVQTHTLLAELTPGDEADTVVDSSLLSSENNASSQTTGNENITNKSNTNSNNNTTSTGSSNAGGRKKTTKKSKTGTKKEKEKEKDKDKDKDKEKDSEKEIDKHVSKGEKSQQKQSNNSNDDTVDDKPLTLEEQEILTETINKLPPEEAQLVIHIIRESAKLSGDEDEIDLEIDQLDTTTQRKLLRHVSKYIKQPKRPKKKSKPSSNNASSQPPKKSEKPKKNSKLSNSSSSGQAAASTSNKKTGNLSSANASSKTSVTSSSTATNKTEINATIPKASQQSFDTDSDSDDDSTRNKKQTVNNDNSGGKHLNSANNGFQIDNVYDDDDDDDDDDDGTPAWNFRPSISNPSDNDSDSSDGKEVGNGDNDEDDAWGVARKEKAQAEAREAERKARELKMKAEAEIAKKQRLDEQEKYRIELMEQRKAEEKEKQEKKKREEKEAEDERRRAREAHRMEIESLEPTVDLDAQRDFMKEFEKRFDRDRESGSASPASDFGF